MHSSGALSVVGETIGRRTGARGGVDTVTLTPSLPQFKTRAPPPRLQFLGGCVTVVTPVSAIALVRRV